MAISLGGVQFAISLKTGRTASQIDRVTKSLVDLTAASQAAGPSLTAIQSALGGAAQNAGTAGQASQQAASDVGDLTAALASLASALGTTQILGFIKDVTLLAGRVQSLRTVLENTGDIAGYSSGELALIEERVKKLGITTQAAREIMTRFAQNQLEVADAVKLARIAQDAAVISGVNSSEAADKMATAIFRLDTRMLRNQGILVNLRQEYQAFGLATGRVETSLTATEKQQIALNAVLRAGVRIQGNYEESLQDVYKQFTSLPRYVEEASRALGEQFLPAFGQVVSAITSGLKSFTEAGRGVQSFTAVMLAAAAGFGTMTTAIGAGSLALVAFRKYGQLVLGMTATMPSALQVLSAAFTGWSGVVVLAASAAAGAWAYWSSKQAEAAEKQQKSIDAVRVGAARLVQLRESVQYLEQFSGATELTTEEQRQLNLEMRKVTDLLPAYSKKLDSSTKSVEDYLAALSTVAPDAFKDLSVVLEQSTSDLAAYDRQIAIFEERIKGMPEFIGTAGIQNPQRDLELEKLDALKAKREQLFNFTEASQQTLNDREERRLTRQYQKQDTAVQLALRLRNRLAEAENKFLDERSLEIVKDFQSQRDSLIAIQVLEEDLASQEKINIAEIAKLKREANESEEAFLRRREDVAAAQLAELQDQRAGIELVREAYTNTARLALMDLGLEEKATRRLRREHELIANGVLPEEARAQAELLDVREQAIAVENQYEYEIAKVNDAMLEQQKILKSVASTPEARIASKTKMSELQDQILLLERAQEGSRQRRIAEEKRLEQQITENRKEENEKRLKDEIDKSKKAAEKRKEDIKDTNEFIADRQASLQDRALPGFKALFDEARSFTDAILGAGSTSQIKNLQQLFAPTIQAQLQEFAKGGASPDQLAALAQVAQNMAGSLDRAAQERTRALALEDAAMQANQQQVQYLKGIYDLLRGNASAVAPEPEGAGSFVGSGSGGFDIRTLKGSSPFLGTGNGDFNPSVLRGAKPYLGSGDASLDLSSMQGAFVGSGVQPFNAATSKSLGGVVTASEKATDSLVGLRDSLLTGFEKVSSAFESQAEFISTLANEVHEVTKSITVRTKAEEAAVRNRGL